MKDEMALVLQRDKILNTLCYNLFKYFQIPQEELDSLKNTYIRGFKGIEFNADGFLTGLKFVGLNIDKLNNKMFLNIKTDFLTTLEFHYCEINSIDDKFLNDVRNLVIFEIKNGNLENLPSGIFGNNPKIEWVDFSYNNLEALPCSIFKIFEMDGYNINIEGNPLFIVRNLGIEAIDKYNYKSIKKIYCKK